MRKKWLLSTLCLAFTMACLLHSYHGGMVEFEPVLSSKGLAQVIQKEFRQGDRIVINGVYEKGSSINYYTHLQVCVLNGHNGNLWYGSYFPDSPPIFYDDASFLDLWNSGRRVFFYSEASPLEGFLSRHPDFKCRLLADKGGKKVMVNW